MDVRNSKEAKLSHPTGCGGESVEGVEDDSVLGNWRCHSLKQKEHQTQKSGSVNNEFGLHR